VVRSKQTLNETIQYELNKRKEKKRKVYILMVLLINLNNGGKEQANTPVKLSSMRLIK